MSGLAAVNGADFLEAAEAIPKGLPRDIIE
jgi:hypothetical protein